MIVIEGLIFLCLGWMIKTFIGIGDRKTLIWPDVIIILMFVFSIGVVISKRFINP